MARLTHALAAEFAASASTGSGRGCMWGRSASRFLRYTEFQNTAFNPLFEIPYLYGVSFWRLRIYTEFDFGNSVSIRSFILETPYLYGVYCGSLGRKGRAGQGRRGPARVAGGRRWRKPARPGVAQEGAPGPSAGLRRAPRPALNEVPGLGRGGLRQWGGRGDGGGERAAQGRQPSESTVHT